MKPLSFMKYAIYGAFALGMIASSNPAMAQRSAVADSWAAGVPETMGIYATVDNSIDLNVTDINFGIIGATSFIGEVGELAISVAGARSINNDANARIVFDSGSPTTQGIMAIDGAFPGTTIYTNYGNVADMDCALCTGLNPELLIVNIVDDQATTPGSWTSTGPVAVEGSGDTDGVTGDLTINIGATINTDNSGTVYESGLYVGSFEVTLEY